MDKGWISVHRKILDNPLVKFSSNYSYAEAWLWLLLRATYSNQKVVLGADIYHLKAGEIITSQKKLCLQFGWGNSRLSTFLKLYKKDNMIDVKTNKKLTMITIINFSDLQKNQSTNKSQTNHKQEHINKDNKVNKDINTRIIEFKDQCSKLLDTTHSEYDNFINYYTEHNDGGRKFKKEFYKTFNIKMRWNTWVKNNKQWNKDPQKSLDDRFPLDKTGNARLGTCSACRSTVFLDKWKPILDSTCCNATVIAKEKK